MRSPARVLLALGLSLTAFAAGAKARADTSAWAFAGAGAVAWRQAGDGNWVTFDKQGKLSRIPAGESRFLIRPTLTFDMGVGTSPDGRVIVGGLFRAQTMIGSGTDLAILARVATHGFQAGDFGLAVDAGGYARLWGGKSGGFLGELTLGAPLGFQLSLQGMVGTNDALAFGAVAGVDLLRLTLYRQTMLDKWQNPSPAWKRIGAALGLVRPRF